MIKIVFTESLRIIRTRYFLIAFWILFSLVLINYGLNVVREYNQVYVSQMFEISKVLSLSDYSYIGYYFRILYPIILVLPSSSVFFYDKATRMDTYILTRCSKVEYYFGKVIAVFLSSFILVTVPLFMELIMSICTLEITAHGDPSGFPIFESMKNDTQNLQLFSLYSTNRLMYYFLGILILGFVSSILSVFNLTIASIGRIKYGFLTILPLYFILLMIGRLKFSFETNYVLILSLFNFIPMNYAFYAGILICMLVVSVCLLVIKIKNDECL